MKDSFDIAVLPDGSAHDAWTASRQSDPPLNRPPLDAAFFREEYFPVMKTIREIGGVEKLASMIDFALRSRNEPFEPDLAKELKEFMKWVARGREHERVHGVGSLIDTTHPIYVATEPERQRLQAWRRSLDLRG